MRRLSALFAVILLISCLFQPAAAVEEVILEDMPEEEIILEEPPAEELPVEEILSEEPAPEDIEDAPDPVLFAAAPEGPSLYFGLLHAHSSLSGGEGAPEEAYAYARDVAGLDFFALTDHSDSFDNAGSASLEEDAASLSLDWAAGKTAAREETTDDFLALFGFEMSWPRQKQLGHISVLFTPGFQSWEQPDFSSAYSGLETFYETLAALSGAIGQFNHPGTEYGTFSDFDHYSESIDRVITLLEIGSGEGTVGGPGYFSALDDYFRALDKGWHLAPVCNQANHQGAWGTANSLRTAVWADSLTEAGLQEALAAYRVYATEDSDLEIHYTLDGHFMGSRVKTWQIGETADITVSLHDPTDDAVGLVEVLTEGGKVLFSQNLEESDGILSVSLLPEYEYYCIKVTQPDGDTALTAPVWVEGIEEAGIQALTCETAVPVQGEPTELTLRLYNREPVPMEVEEVTVSVDGEAIFTQKSPEETEDLSFPLTITHAGVGSARVEVSVSVSLGGAVRIYSEEISLFFRQSDMVRDVIVDGTHDNFLPEELTALEALAAEENIRLRVETEAITPEMLESCGLLILPPPGKAYDSAFLDRLKSYAAYGGSFLILGGETNSAQQNRVLKALSSTVTIKTEESDIFTSTSPAFTQQINRKADWCARVSESQSFRLIPSRSLNSGGADWLVMAADRVYLAAEPLSGGGTVFVSGGWFFGDAELTEPESPWAEPFANQSVARALLGMAARELPCSSIGQARQAPADTLLRVRGHVTAVFSDRLYLQDASGGIAVTGSLPETIAVGTALEVTGTLGTDDRGKYLTCAGHSFPEEAAFRHLPRTGDWTKLLDPDLHGGELVEIEGICTRRVLSEDGTLTGFALSDPSGNTAAVVLPAGANTLSETVQEGSTIRTIGILTNGPQIRVRNPEEVVYVPPKTQKPEATVPETTAPETEDTYVNPKTGDPLLGMLPGLAALLCLPFFRKRK